MTTGTAGLNDSEWLAKWHDNSRRTGSGKGTPFKPAGLSGAKIGTDLSSRANATADRITVAGNAFTAQCQVTAKAAEDAAARFVAVNQQRAPVGFRAKPRAPTTAEVAKATFGIPKPHPKLVELQMQTAEVLANGVRKIDEAVAAAVSISVNAAQTIVKAACDSSPTAQQFCQLAGPMYKEVWMTPVRAAKDVSDATGVTSLVKTAYHAKKRKDEETAQQMARDYSLPIERTRAHIANGNTILLAALTMGRGPKLPIGGGVGKQVVKKSTERIIPSATRINVGANASASPATNALAAAAPKPKKIKKHFHASTDLLFQKEGERLIVTVNKIETNHLSRNLVLEVRDIARHMAQQSGAKEVVFKAYFQNTDLGKTCLKIKSLTHQGNEMLPWFYNSEIIYDHHILKMAVPKSKSKMNTRRLEFKPDAKPFHARQVTYYHLQASPGRTAIATLNRPLIDLLHSGTPQKFLSEVKAKALSAGSTGLQVRLELGKKFFRNDIGLEHAVQEGLELFSKRYKTQITTDKLTGNKTYIFDVPLK